MRNAKLFTILIMALIAIFAGCQMPTGSDLSDDGTNGGSSDPQPEDVYLEVTAYYPWTFDSVEYNTVFVDVVNISENEIVFYGDLMDPGYEGSNTDTYYFTSEGSTIENVVMMDTVYKTSGTDGFYATLGEKYDIDPSDSESLVDTTWFYMVDALSGQFAQIRVLGNYFIEVDTGNPTNPTLDEAHSAFQEEDYDPTDIDSNGQAVPNSYAQGDYTVTSEDNVNVSGNVVDIQSAYRIENSWTEGLE